MPETHRHNWDQRRSEIWRAQPRWNAAITKYLGQELLSCVIERATKRFAMHAADKGLGHRLPVFDEWPQTVWMEHEAEYVARAVWRPPV